MFYSDVIDMLCLYIQQSLFDLLQNSINELLLEDRHHLVELNSEAQTLQSVRPLRHAYKYK